VPGSPESVPYAYAVLRLVPRVERGERINIGVVLFCRQRDAFLGALTKVDEGRLRALGPEVDPQELRELLIALTAVAAGDPAAGAIAALDPSERFGWLVAPSSTIIQPGEVHTGLCIDPQERLEALYEQLVP
jgi:hypothetical protein